MKIGRMYLDVNVLDYQYEERFFTDYGEMIGCKNELETNEHEQNLHQTIVSVEVVW